MAKIYKSEGPWGSGSGGSNGSGRGRSGSSSSGGSGGSAPDFEAWIENLQRKLNNSFFGRGGNSGRFLLIALAVLGVWVGSGIYRVLPDEEGVVTRFGAYDRSTQAGLHYHLPYPIEAVLKPKVTISNRIDVGMRVFSSSTVFGTNQKTQTRDIPQESLMLTGDENIIDVNFSVLWKISKARDFLFNIQNPVGTVKVVAESVMREIVGKNTLQPILTGDKQRIEENVKVLMQKTLDKYGAGIVITQVKMQKVDPPAAVIDSFRDVQAARADQERMRNEAFAYRNRVVPEARGESAKLILDAEGYREKTVAESEGEALRFLAIYNEYRTATNVTRKRIFLETMEKILEKADKIIIDPDNNSGVVPYLPLEKLQKNKGEK